jgi:prolyl-tRNA editing enzyme YbaK/EbsC (Cys-tRNA(Pro) deacylase)
MDDSLSASAQKVQDALQAKGYSSEVVELPASTRTAAEAAEAISCQVGQIVKSLVFKTKRTNQPILVLASGSNQVNEKKIGHLIGEPITKAEADFVRQHSGYAIGGVPPLGHTDPLQTFIDRDLLQYGEVWAAAGTPHAVFRLSPDDLEDMTTGQIVDVS